MERNLTTERNDAIMPVLSTRKMSTLTYHRGGGGGQRYYKERYNNLETYA